jgi:hypothetical protein
MIVYDCVALNEELLASVACTVKLVADAVAVVGVPVKVVVAPVVDEKLNQEGSVEPLATDQL